MSKDAQHRSERDNAKQLRQAETIPPAPYTETEAQPTQDADDATAATVEAPLPESDGTGTANTLQAAPRPLARGSNQLSPQDSARDAAPAPESSWCAGTRIGQYELIRMLGRGGMGEVHLARDLRLGRRVAVKLLLGQSGDGGERFLAEARTTARCHHEHIVVIHDLGEHQRCPYMVLEYLEGKTLRQWLNEQPPPESAGRSDRAALVTPLPPGRAIELMLPVVRALAYAHERGIVHRDLKPENIMLTRSGGVKVLDFGIAKLLEAERESETSTPAGADAPPLATRPLARARSSSLIGTLAYMAPEQMNVDDIDHRCDIWAVGVMLLELVLGRHPVLQHSTAELMSVADIDMPMPRVAELVPNGSPELMRLGAVIERCLIKDPLCRTEDASTLLAELEALAPSHARGDWGEDGSPYAGLAAFQESDAGRFFGRANDIEQICADLHSRPMVAVVGPSGVGKSSLIRAGVIPALKRSSEGWDVQIIRPGREPLSGLASALVRTRHSLQRSGPQRISAAITGDNLVAQLIDSGANTALTPLVERMRAEPGYLGARLRSYAASKRRRVLLFVDQFEELYTLDVSASERAAYLACLAGVADDASSPLRLVLSMRSDFIDRMAENRHLGAEIARSLVLLPAMGKDGLRAALTEPLAASEYRFESDALVERMISALDATPGALPLLQFTAARLWELRDSSRRLLTEHSYESIGGVAGALASHADTVVRAMPSPQQALARLICERLVTPERTRALVSLDELCELHPNASAVDAVVQHLAAMRLAVIERNADGDHIVELIHESLIDRWPTLTRWLDENQEDAHVLARLRAAAQEWEKRDRDPGLLWRGQPAAESALWRQRYRGTLSQRERAFLDAVTALGARSTRLRRSAVAGVIGLLLVLLAGAVAMLLQIRGAEREAARQAEIARTQARASDEARQAAVDARRETAAQAQAARERAREAERARNIAEAAQREADEARQAAEFERSRAQRETHKTRRALVRVQTSEARARAAETDARTALTRAEQLAEAERKAKDNLQGLIDRSLGHVTDELSAPAPSSPTPPKP